MLIWAQLAEFTAAGMFFLLAREYLYCRNERDQLRRILRRVADAQRRRVDDQLSLVRRLADGHARKVARQGQDG